MHITEKTYNRRQLRGEMAKLDGVTGGEGGGAKAFETIVGTDKGQHEWGVPGYTHKSPVPRSSAHKTVTLT